MTDCWYRDWTGSAYLGNEKPLPWAPGFLIGTAAPDIAHVVRRDGRLGAYLFWNVRVGGMAPEDEQGGSSA